MALQNYRLQDYEGLIDQLIRFLYDSPEIINNEREMTQIIKNRLLFRSDMNLNQNDYLLKLRDGGSYFNNLLQQSIQKILIEKNILIDKDGTEKYYSPSEIAEILTITKGIIHIWIDKGYLRNYRQTMKGGKIEIPTTDMDKLIIQYPKYKNRWENRTR